MSTFYDSDGVTIHHGDCLDVLATLPDASVDSVVTDPPYGLSFMGKKWDKPTPRPTPASDHGGRSMLGHVSANWHDKGTHSRGYADNDNAAFGAWCEQWARECLRVLKPGGHIVAFGGTRTWHRLACAIEDAGFEVRDSLAWCYASGFPKSLDVSKAIDKARTEDVEPLRVICRAVRAAMDARGLRSRDLVRHFGDCHPRLIDHWAARDTDSQPSLPTWEQWETLRDLLPEIAEHDAETWRLNGRKGKPGDAWDEREVTGAVEQWSNRVNYAVTSRDGLRRDKPATEDARRWEGWGTALKPAFEPIVLARKPIGGTVAANVLTHGTGALNVDGCRIGNGGQIKWAEPRNMGYHGGSDSGTTEATANPAGRWPSNLLLDAHQAAALDAMSGETTSKAGGTSGTNANPMSWAERNPGRERGGHNDSGGASRFFFVAKADSNERPRVDGIAHPTVKPIDLMRWLVRLVTPPGGTVLEPFAGSGTTIEAAILEGFPIIGIEREADYLPLIEARITRRRDPVRAVELAGEDGGLFDLLDEGGAA